MSSFGYIDDYELGVRGLRRPAGPAELRLPGGLRLGACGRAGAQAAAEPPAGGVGRLPATGPAVGRALHDPYGLYLLLYTLLI